MRFEDTIGSPDAPVPGDPVLNTRLPQVTRRSPEQYLFEAVVLAAEACYRQQLPITPSTIHSENPSLLEAAIERVLEGTKFARSMEDRGIPFGGWNGLTAEQANFLRIVLDPTSSVPLRKRYRAAGVTQSKLSGWMRNPEFERRYREMSHEVLSDSMPVARTMVATGIAEGKLEFIKFGMELEREWDPRGGAAADVVQFGLAMLNVLAEELKDLPDSQAIMASISDRMQRVLAGQPDTPKQVPAMVIHPAVRE